MKKLVTFRLDPALLERARLMARAENRTLTNFVETVLKRSFEPGQRHDHAENASPGEVEARAD